MSFNNSKKLETWTGTEDYCPSATSWVSCDPWQDGYNMPQHTPKKLSKIELNGCTSAPQHDKPSTCALELDSKEDYLIDFESVHMSRYHGSRIENKINGINVNPVSACQTSGISYSTVSSMPSFSNQWQRTSAATILLDKDKTKYPETSNNESQSNVSDNLYSQEMCTQSACSQQPPALAALKVPMHSKLTNQECRQDTQLDLLTDQGYSSNSTGSSYQGQDSQREGSVMEQGSQRDPGSEERGWSAGNRSVDCYCISGENELEDLLYHFQNFFQDRFESEFHRYQEAVYGIIQEQQNHVRQIVHTVIREQSPSQRSYTEELLSEETEKMSGMSKSTNQPEISFTQMLDTDFYLPVRVPSAPLSNSSSVVKEEKVNKRLLDLYSLSCSVSTLLARNKFKS